jgi:putative ABC transport system permease protein
MKLNWFRQQREEEFNAEIRSHLDAAIRDRIARGEMPDEARANALREFGNVGLVKETTREMWGWGSLERLTQDLRFGLRMLRKNPGFSLIAILTLALGIGANTAIFSVVNAVLLQPLPYEQSEQLVRVYATNDTKAENLPVSYLNFADWRQQNTQFESMAGYAFGGATFTRGELPEQLQGMIVAGDFFAVLKTRLEAGRLLTRADEAQGKQVVIISHSLWQRRFAADAGIIGRTITLDAAPYTVIGVLAAGFRFPASAATLDFWVPLNPHEGSNTMRDARSLQVIARLKPGATLTQAQAEMTTIAARLEQQYGFANAGAGVKLVSLHTAVVGNVRPALMILLGAVGCVLLIACANVANLLLARDSVRGRELAVRAALGAGRGRILRQLLTENLLLFGLGGGLGLVMAGWSIWMLTGLLPEDMPRVSEIRLDAQVFRFACGLTLLTGFCFGLLPAWQASRTNLAGAMKEGGRGAGEGALGQPIRNALIVAEVALSLLLLVGAGLLLQSFRQLLAVNPGFDPRQVLTAEISLSSARYDDAPRQSAFFSAALERIAALPGVQSAALTSILPFINDGSFAIEGRAQPAPGERPGAQFRIISVDYLKVMGIPLVAGRGLEARDQAQTPRVVLVNQTFARRFFPDENPVGQRLRLPLDEAKSVEIVGVIGDVRHGRLEHAPAPECYGSLLQFPVANVTLAVKAEAGDPLHLTEAVRKAIAHVDQDQPLYEVSTLAHSLGAARAGRRFNLSLLGAFALLALILAAVGLYGVISHAVTQRTRELGIRIALGAQHGDVLRLVVGQGMKLAFVGVALGLAGALALTRLMKTLLFEVSATDPLTFTMIALLLICVALLACMIPARRATEVDPMAALKCE